MSYVGYTGVANQAQTTPGCASGVVADANNGYGDDTGGSGVVDTYSCLVPPVPPTSCYFLMEDSGFVLQQDDSKIELEVC